MTFKAAGGKKHFTKRTEMGTTSEEIIVITEDEDEEDCSLSRSVVIVENEEKKNDKPCPIICLDDDLVVTFSRAAEVLPHARYDCPIHAFTATDRDLAAPAASNQLICDQCFCYICDKLASACQAWTSSGACHCNSHKKSDFWKNIRNSLLLGRLQDFNLTLLDVDQHLRNAGFNLQNFRVKLAAEYSSFLNGSTIIDAQKQQVVAHDYTQVYQCVSWFLNLADLQESRAAAVMRLGAAQDFLRHALHQNSFVSPGSVANVSHGKFLLLTRVVVAVQRQIMMGDLTSEFSLKLQDFYNKLTFSQEAKVLKNRLSMRLWDDILLVSVLKGQNVSGTRKNKGRRDFLAEDISVVQLRLEFLLRERRYRELQRYLRTVKANNQTLLQQLQDLIPYFMCLEGDFWNALKSLFLAGNGPMTRLSPSVFLIYFRIFETGLAPKLLIQPTHISFAQDPWESVTGAVPLQRLPLLRFALRVFGCCPAVMACSQCWTSLLMYVNKTSASVKMLPAPPLDFLQAANITINKLLLENPDLHLSVPQHLHEMFPDQTVLLLVTGVLVIRIVQRPLTPLLPVLANYKETEWAFVWLLHRLSSRPERLVSFMQEVRAELDLSTDASCLFLSSLLSTLTSTCSQVCPSR